MGEGYLASGIERSKNAGGGFRTVTLEDVFRDLQARRAGLIKALTTDSGKMYEQCDPSKENLSLYGHANGTWEVNMPADEVPPEIPEPVVGINFARDGMPEREWRILVALHSDLWLLSVAFCFGGRLGFNKAQRRRLFTMINDLPTLLEIVSEQATKEKPSASNHSSNKSKSNSKRESQRKHPKTLPPKPKCEDDEGLEEEGVDDDEHDDDTLCGACEQNYSSDKFWICCDDVCEKWFHGTCEKITPAHSHITPAQAEYIANILEETMIPQ